MSQKTRVLMKGAKLGPSGPVSFSDAHQRPQMKKSLADIYAFLSTSHADERNASLSMFDKSKREVHVTSIEQLPIGSPLAMGESVVERISSDIVLFSDKDEERVLHLSSMSACSADSASSAATLDTTPLDDEDSPLLTRTRDNLVLYGGEEVVFSVTEVPVRSVRGPSTDIGYLLVTNYRLVFFPAALVATRETVTPHVLLQHLTRKLATSVNAFPLTFVRFVKTEKVIPFDLDDERDSLLFGAALVSNTMVRIGLVDGRLLSLEFSHTHLDRNQLIVATLVRLLDRSQTKPFAFHFRPVNPYTFDGWSAYNFFREMRRIFQPAPAVLVLDEEDATSAPIIGAKAAQMRPTEWRVADVSRLCPTYPKFIAVPRHVSDEQLAAIAAFRTMGRLPALAFLHPESGAALVRCSQPLSGITQARCEEDEFLFQEMVRRNPSGQGMVIYDARPFLNAAWNRGVKGAGYENEACYNCKVLFLDIQNVHKVRDSHEALLTQYYADAEDTASSQQLEEMLPSGPSSDGSLSDGWVLTVSKLLDGALKISESLAKGVCATVHCLAADQEVWTNRGFLGLEEMSSLWIGVGMSEGLQVGAVSRSTHQIEWQDCERLVLNQGRLDGVVIVFVNVEANVNVAVTPEHEMYVAANDGCWRKLRAGAVFDAVNGNGELRFAMLVCVGGQMVPVEIGRENVRWEKYCEATWCVTVAGGLIVTRRRGPVATAPVVVGNCSDGWDRTPLLTSLAMLLSDPFLRTLMGFQILIESQWIGYGHKMAARNGSGEDFSPVFLQWLDCCWQLVAQQPQTFEFNERFLFRIAREVFSGRFGTFLANSAAERAEKYQPFTQSLWSDINSRASEQQQYLRSDFRHAFASAPIWANAQRPKAAPESAVKWNFHPSNLKICRELHCYWE